MRLFVAVDPSPSAVAHLRAVVAGLADAWAGLRWAPPEQWHVTLAFLGEVAERHVDELGARLARAAAKSPEFSLVLGSFGAFSSARRAGVVWAGLSGDVADLRRLAERSGAAARRTGIAVDDKRFRAHLTIARVRRPPLDVRPLIESYADYTGPPWRVQELRLVRSHLGAQARHETLATWPLAEATRRS